MRVVALLLTAPVAWEAVIDPPPLTAVFRPLVGVELPLKPTRPPACEFAPTVMRPVAYDCVTPPPLYPTSPPTSPEPLTAPVAYDCDMVPWLTTSPKELWLNPTSPPTALKLLPPLTVPVAYDCEMAPKLYPTSPPTPKALL